MSDPNSPTPSRGSTQPPRRPPVRPGPGSWRRWALLYLLLGFGSILLFQHFVRTQGGRRVPYSELKTKIAAGAVEHVVLGENLITATPTDSARQAGDARRWEAVPVEDPDLVKLLEEKGIRFEGAARSAWGQALGFILPLALLLLIWIWFMRRMNPAQTVMTFGRTKPKLYAEEGTGVTFDDVAGVDEAEQELQEVIEFLKNPKRFTRLGAKIPKGILLVGPPGTGKTLLARAVAGEASVPFFHISGSEFVEMFVGVGAARVRDLFGQARAKAPCIIFIDELDALAKARGIGGPLGGHDEREQTLNQLLVEMDGFDPRIGVIIMAATNRPEILDPALLRPGRFDRHVLVDRPDVKGREAILRVHAKGIKLDPDVNLGLVARRTPGFVGSDLANLLNEAALLAARKDKAHVTMQEIDEAIDRITAGLEKRNRLINPREKEIVAYHESGHALVARRVPHADPVHKVSIIPRGIGALGYTQQLPTEDRYLLTRSELLDRIAVMLGGRVAEEIVFGEVSTGAQNDLSRATDLARRMVTEYGMSETLGPVTYSGERRTLLGLRESLLGERREYSEDTAREIDAEVRRIIDEQRERVREILTRDRAALEALAERLLEKEVLEAEELDELLKAFERAALPARP